MKTKLFFAVLCFLFILPKLLTLGIRLSDSNIYFYTAYELLHGKLLYKDIFFTNFPFLPYISTVYYFLVFGKLQLYYVTSSIEAITTAVLLFLIVKKQFNNRFYEIITPLLYLFSFIVLSTSDHQTGVFNASLFAVLGYFLTLRKQYVWAGISLGIMLMTKAYFLPVFLALSLEIFIRERKHISAFLSGTFVSIFVILFPSILFARKELWHDVLAYSLTRSQGISKINIIWFFIKHDFLLFSLFISSLLMIRKQLFLGLVSLFGLLFFMLYKDIYYLYLNFLVPFLCLTLPFFLERTKKHISSQKAMVVTACILFLGINYFIYISGYSTLGKISDITPLTNTITKTKPSVLYGMNDITPALAYLTNTPLLQNIIDTNENIYRKGFLNAKSLTHVAIHEKAMLVAHGAIYPEQDVQQFLIGETFDRQQVDSHCILVQQIPVKSEGIENRITLFSCR